MTDRSNLWLFTGIVLGLLSYCALDSHGQPRNGVPCWPVPNGNAFTIQCANGYYSTTLPDGTIEEGTGLPDPSATNPGSQIPLDAQGNIMMRGAVQPPPPNQQNAAPGSWYYFGGTPPQ